MTTATHTPGPWAIDHTGMIITDAAGGWLADTRTVQRGIEEDKANARLIITACNAHDQLVADNAALRADLNDARSNWESAAEELRQADLVREQLVEALKIGRDVMALVGVQDHLIDYDAVSKGRKIVDAALLAAPRLAAANAVRQAEPERMDTDESREYLVKFMEQNFTDTTFHRYIRGQISGSAPLAGDFAWQMARALRMLPAASPAAVGAGDQKPVAWLRFWARQSYDGRGNIDYGDGLEVCAEGERGDDGVAAFPVYGRPTVNGATGAP